MQLGWIAALGLVVGFAPSRAAAQKVEHPLDPLSFQEFWTVLEVLRDARHLDDKTRFSGVNLREPAKDFVWSWSPGQDFPRQAAAVVRQEAETHEALVDLKQRKLVSWTRLADAQPSWLDEEFTAMEKEVKKDPRFVEAMKKRGIADFTFIQCAGVPPGYFGTEEQRGRRLAHMHCQDARGARNLWPRGISGLTVVVDLTAKKILRVVDEGVVPVPGTSADYDPATIGDVREVPSPLRVDQPLGPGFRLRGNVVEWQKWRFHARSDPRVGTVVSAVTYDDGGRPRPVLYQGHLSEIFVPYMDPAFDWYHRNFIDAGEFSAGGLTKPLLPGRDCPEHATYQDGLVSDDAGRPKAVPAVLCLFERESGDPAWRHFSQEPESRRKRDLVVRSAAVLGNYDYVFDWVFDLGGGIAFRGGATGIDGVKGVRAQTLSDPSAAEDTAWGALVAPGRVAVNHDHFFSVRLDFDVDGMKNRFVRDVMAAQRMPETSLRKSLWHMHSEVAKVDTDAKYRLSYEHPSMWRVESSEQKNALGYPSSYMLHAEGNALPLVDEDDMPLARALFATQHLWVTPYDPGERWAAGDYPNQSEPGQGLPAWTKDRRSVENTDIVLWYTLGFHHMPSAEDWPVYNLGWHSLSLRPYNFFDRNPALDATPLEEPSAQPSSGGSGSK
jgi:primary-amine oxidase